MVHAGRGIPALGRHAYELTALSERARDPRARGGFRSCVSCGVTPTSGRTCSTTPPGGRYDFMALFSLVPPGRILIASDAPYGSPAGGFLYAMRCALQVGPDPAQIACADGWSDWQAGEELIDAPGRRLAAVAGTDPLLGRVHEYLHTAVADAHGPTGRGVRLARLACEASATTLRRRRSQRRCWRCSTGTRASSPSTCPVTGCSPWPCRS